MHSEEPTLLSHLLDVRSKLYTEPDGIGLTNIIFAGKLRTESDLSEGLLAHRKIVEEEVNSSEADITGILMGQVISLLIIFIFLSKFLIPTYISRMNTI